MLSLYPDHFETGFTVMCRSATKSSTVMAAGAFDGLYLDHFETSSKVSFDR